MSSFLAKPSWLLSAVLGVLLVLFGVDIYVQKQTLQTLVGEMTAQQVMFKKLSEQMKTELQAMAVKPQKPRSDTKLIQPSQQDSYHFDQRPHQQQHDSQPKNQLKNLKKKPPLPHPKSDLEILEALSMDDATSTSDLKFDLDENLQTKINGQHIADPEAELIDHNGKGSQIKLQYDQPKVKEPVYITYQVARSSNQKNANDFCDRLKQDQYNCSVKSVVVKGANYYKVLVHVTEKNSEKAVQYFNMTHHIKIFKVSS